MPKDVAPNSSGAGANFVSPEHTNVLRLMEEFGLEFTPTWTIRSVVAAQLDGSLVCYPGGE